MDKNEQKPKGIIPELEAYKKKFSSEDIYHDKDGSRWLRFVFYLHISDEFYTQPPIAFSIWKVTPNRWTFRDTLVSLAFFFSANTSIYDIVTIGRWRNRDERESEPLEISTYDFFENEVYLSYPENNIKDLVFIIQRPLDTKAVQDIRDELSYMNYWGYHEFWSFKKTSYAIDSIFESLYRANGREFDITRNEIMLHKGIEYIDMLSLLFFAGLIKITSIGLTDRRERDGWVIDYSFWVFLTNTFTQILDNNIEQKDLLIESAFNKDYKKLTLLKKNGKPHMLERDIEEMSDATRFVELQQKYPNSEIKVKNYKGKVMKYEIKEKIKMDQSGPI